MILTRAILAVEFDLLVWTELAAGEAEGALHPAVKATLLKIAMSERSDRLVGFIRFFMLKKIVSSVWIT